MADALAFERSHLQLKIIFADSAALGMDSPTLGLSHLMFQRFIGIIFNFCVATSLNLATHICLY